MTRTTGIHDFERFITWCDNNGWLLGAAERFGMTLDELAALHRSFIEQKGGIHQTNRSLALSLIESGWKTYRPRFLPDGSPCGEKRPRRYLRPVRP